MAKASFLLLPETTITGAGTVTGDAYVLGHLEASALIAETIFTYGSGGTSAKLYIQTSIDNGATWFDIANHAYTTASASKVSALSTGIAPGAQAFTPTDGTLADGTVVNGVIGDRIRAKLISLGTYAGNTKIACWVSLKGGRQ